MESDPIYAIYAFPFMPFMPFTYSSSGDKKTCQIKNIIAQKTGT
jgi:hypothetical protein